MQVVIEIDDNLYVRLFDNGVENYDDAVGIEKAIRNGTILPKGHGRLIDEKEVYHEFFCRCLGGVARNVLEETPTIIEADKESEG